MHGIGSDTIVEDLTLLALTARLLLCLVTDHYWQVVYVGVTPGADDSIVEGVGRETVGNLDF